MMNKEAQEISKDEGFESHVYKCPRGFDTIGKGYNLEANPLKLTDFEIKDFYKNGISEKTADYLLIRYIDEIERTLQLKVEGFAQLNEARRGILINMAYQMGIDGLLKFKNMLIALKHDEYELAAKEMKNSRWYTQTPNRAKRLIERMKTGEYA